MTAKRFTKGFFALLAAGLMAAFMFAVAGCGNQNSSAGGGKSGSIQVKGSDTMVNLAQMWAEDYMKDNPQVNIAVTGGGSGTGITAIINGTTDIADASREMKQKEKDDAKANGVEVVENKVALDGIAIVVNMDNGISELSIDQLADIFSGKVTDWKDVGGTPGQIVILSRESNSGTHVFFKEHILNKGKSDGKVEYASSALLLPSSQAIVDEVKQNPRGIGYVGLGYVKGDLKSLKVKKDDASAAVTATVASVQDGSYPVSRPLYMYTKQGASQTVQDYLAWIKSPAGQKVVEDLEFVPLKK
ncbi:MAG: PstS family phosphate ABC transporter substrate-binding protein [Thermoleophilia bacterium]